VQDSYSPLRFFDWCRNVPGGLRARFESRHRCAKLTADLACIDIQVTVSRVFVGEDHVTAIVAHCPYLVLHMVTTAVESAIFGAADVDFINYRTRIYRFEESMLNIDSEHGMLNMPCSED